MLEVSGFDWRLCLSEEAEELSKKIPDIDLGSVHTCSHEVLGQARPLPRGNHLIEQYCKDCNLPSLTVPMFLPAFFQHSTHEKGWINVHSTYGTINCKIRTVGD